MNPYASHAYRIQNEDDISINLLMNASLFNDSFFSFVAGFKAIGKFYLDYLLSACTKEGQNSIIFHNKNPEKTDIYIENIIQEYFKNSTYIETNVRCYLILLYSEFMNQTSEVQPELERRITDI
ncbi:MAG: hypothetical protein LUE92_05125, partial [Clostridiales bacterium]|nr:hypothetical protein [Clostridiales bacterium]